MPEAGRVSEPPSPEPSTRCLSTSATPLEPLDRIARSFATNDGFVEFAGTAAHSTATGRSSTRPISFQPSS